MKKSFLYLIVLSVLFSVSLSAQDVLYEFANAQQSSSGGNDYYEVDIMVSSAAGFKMGSGQLYFDYNPQAFGNSVAGGGRAVITTNGYLLGQSSGPFGIYTSFIMNDNTGSRLSFSWQQALSSGCIPMNNVGATATALLHLQLQYIPGGTAFAPGVCFTSAAPFDDQTFTACGPGASCTFPDCAAAAGVQITNDLFDCSNAPLPAELLGFDLRKEGASDVLLFWRTASEIQMDYYEIQRSTDAFTWDPVGTTAALGAYDQITNYEFLDRQVYGEGSASATYYYRLKMIDLDGSYEFSAIRTVLFSGGSTFSVYPNPTSWGVNIQEHSARSSEGAKAKLYALDGRLLLEQQLEGDGDELLFPASFTGGVYRLVIYGPEGAVRLMEKVLLLR